MKEYTDFVKERIREGKEEEERRKLLVRFSPVPEPSPKTLIVKANRKPSVSKFSKVLNKSLVNKPILKETKRPTLVISAPNNVPYKSHFFNEERIDLENNFLFGK